MDIPICLAKHHRYREFETLSFQTNDKVTDKPLYLKDIKPFMGKELNSDGTFIIERECHPPSPEFINLIIDNYNVTPSEDNVTQEWIVHYFKIGIIKLYPTSFIQQKTIKFLLSRNLIKSMRHLARLDNNFIMDYFQNREIPPTFIKYVHLNCNTTLAKFMSDRDMLNSKICFDQLISITPNYLEASKILVQYIQPHSCSIGMISHGPESDKIQEYISQLWGIPYDIIKFDKYKLPDIIESRSISQYVKNCTDLESLLYLDKNYGMYDDLNIYGSVYIIKNEYYTTGFNDNCSAKIKIKSLMGYLVFSKKFEWAAELGQELLENNYRDMLYYYIEKMYEEYYYFLEQHRSLKSSSSSICKQISDIDGPK